MNLRILFLIFLLVNELNEQGLEREVCEGTNGMNLEFK